MVYGRNKVEIRNLVDSSKTDTDINIIGMGYYQRAQIFTLIQKINYDKGDKG